MNQCTKIKISGNEYPVRFDYFVLKEVSEKYDSIRKFEMELLGLGVIGKNENGTERLGKVKDPSISCIMFLLPKMINSALDYLGFEQVEEKQIIREIDINFAELSDILHDEMNKCFKSTVEVKKKYNPTPKKVV